MALIQGDIVLYIHPGSADGYFWIKTSPAIVLTIHPSDAVVNGDGEPMLDLYVLTAPTYNPLGELLAPGGTYTNLKCFHKKTSTPWENAGRQWCHRHEVESPGLIDY